MLSYKAKLIKLSNVIYLGDRQRGSGACKPCDLETKCKLVILRLERFTDARDKKSREMQKVVEE